jgi:molybdenum cofactor biosynthesis protein MoaF
VFACVDLVDAYVLRHRWYVAWIDLVQEVAMKPDPIRGSTIRWTFADGPTAGTTFEHTFGKDGMVHWRSIEHGRPQKDSSDVKYQVAKVNDRVYAVSYLSESGYTLTCVLDLDTGRIAGFASNEKQLVLQRGTFEVAKKAA